VTEADDGRGEEFGPVRLASALRSAGPPSAAGLLDDTIAEVRRFSQGDQATTSRSSWRDVAKRRYDFPSYAIRQIRPTCESAM
jgi:hypothetical protein